MLSIPMTSFDDLHQASVYNDFHKWDVYLPRRLGKFHNISFVFLGIPLAE